jgi:hypothetical protein
MLGSLTGFGASLFYGGEFFGGASKAGAVTERALLGGAEHAFEEAAVKELGGEAMGQVLARIAPAGEAVTAAKLGPGLARKMLASGAGTAVEGAILSTPKALTEAALGDPEQAAETLLYGAGGGALLGLVGPLGKEIKGAIGNSLSGLKILGTGVETEGKSFLGKLADKQAFRSIASNQASLKAALREAERVGGAEGVGSTLLELDLVPKFGESAEAYAERLAAVHNEWGEKIGGMYAKVDALGEKLDTKKIVSRLEKEVVKPLAAKPGFEAIEGGVQKYLDSFVTKASAEGEGLTFQKLHDWRASLDDLVYREARAASPVVEELRKVRAILQDEMQIQGDAAAAKVGKEFARPLKEANLVYGRLSAAKAGAEDYITREATNRVLSPTDYGMGLGSAVLGAASGSPLAAIKGALAGLGHHVVRKEGNALAARALSWVDRGGLLGIERAMKGTAERLDGIPGALERLATGAPVPYAEGEGSETLPTHALTSLIRAMTSGGDKGKAFESVSDAITKATSDPTTMASKLEGLVAPFSKDAPKIAGIYAAKLTQTMAYLQEHLPKKPEPASPFSPVRPWRPSDAQLSDFAARLAVAVDPFVALKKLETRTLSTADVDTLKALYPKIYEAMRAKVLEHAASGQARPLPYADRLKLAKLLDAPLDRSLADLAAYQGTFAAEAAAEGGGGPRSGGGGSSGHSMGKIPGNESTAFQQIAER